MKNQKTQNPYHKCCPHCQKEFNARRLNQTYCTYFCKVQFNNERARLRRLQLLEIEKAHQASNVISPPKVIEKQKFPITHISNKHIIKTKEQPSFNWKKDIKIGLGFFALGVILYSIYKYVNQNRQENISPNLRVQNDIKPPINQVEEIEKPEEMHPIPLEIFQKPIEESTSQLSQPPPDFMDHSFQNQQNKHPDVAAIIRTLKKNNII